MTEHTTKRYNDGEVPCGVQRRRRWTQEEKVRIVEETYLPGISVSLVARQHDISGSQISTWRGLMAQGALTAAGAGEEVVPASEYRALQEQIAELQRVPGKKTMEAEILREAVSGPQAQKTAVALDLTAKGWPVSAVAEALGVSRQHLSAMHHRPPPRPCLAAPPGCPKRSHRAKSQTGLPGHEGAWPAAPAPQRAPEERRHKGRVAVDRRNTRWCSDALEIACDNAEKVRVAFELDCCDREAMGHVATTGGVTAEDTGDLMVATVEHLFCPMNRLAAPIEWLTDNGNSYVAGDTRRFARDTGLVARTTPVSSPQSNGMAEAFVRMLKRDYVRVNPTPDACTVLEQLRR